MSKKMMQLLDVVTEAYKPDSGSSGSLSHYIYNQALKSRHGETHPDRCFAMASELEMGIFQLQALVAALQRVGFTGE